MQYLRALAYVSYIMELITIAGTWRGREPEDLAEQIADVLYRAVDYALMGTATRTVDREKLTSAVGDMVAVVDDVL